MPKHRRKRTGSGGDLASTIPDSFGSLKGTVRYHGDIVAPDPTSWDEA